LPYECIKMGCRGCIYDEILIKPTVFELGGGAFALPRSKAASLLFAAPLIADQRVSAICSPSTVLSHKASWATSSSRFFFAQPWM
jgi:hypothetical protein